MQDSSRTVHVQHVQHAPGLGPRQLAAAARPGVAHALAAVPPAVQRLATHAGALEDTLLAAGQPRLLDAAAARDCGHQAAGRAVAVVAGGGAGVAAGQLGAAATGGAGGQGKRHGSEAEVAVTHAME